MRWKSILVSFCVLLAIVVWMLSGNVGSDAVREAAQERENTERQEKKEVKPFLVEVVASTARPFLRKMTIIGRTQASRRSEIKAELSAVVQEVFVEEGQQVAKGDMIARLSVDTRQSSFAAAEASLVRSRKNHQAIKGLTKGGYQSDIELLTASETLAQAKQQYEQAKKALDDTKIVAPYAGVLQEVMIEEGELVSLAQSVAKILDLDPLEAIIHVSEQELAQIKLQQDALIRLVNAETAQGKISYIAPSSDQNTGTFEVRVLLNNPDMRLREGLSGNVSITVEPALVHFHSKNVLTLDDLGRIGVKGVGDDNIVTFYPVNIVDDNDEGVYLDGLPDQFDIIVQGQDYVVAGAPVSVFRQ